jgi:hypothetical protein
LQLGDAEEDGDDGTSELASGEVGGGTGERAGGGRVCVCCCGRARRRSTLLEPDGEAPKVVDEDELDRRMAELNGRDGDVSLRKKTTVTVGGATKSKAGKEGEVQKLRTLTVDTISWPKTPACRRGQRRTSSC